MSKDSKVSLVLIAVTIVLFFGALGYTESVEKGLLKKDNVELKQRIEQFKRVLAEEQSLVDKQNSMLLKQLSDDQVLPVPLTTQADALTMVCAVLKVNQFKVLKLYHCKDGTFTATVEVDTDGR